ncbi:hypothetical protein WMF11_31140 [Sorangium sp. So ce295]|uniref:hypothetical protein n=1 Tax=Sorangium sp. So ce295 TaxID=3133295 RepID=UPI003F61736B
MSSTCFGLRTPTLRAVTAGWSSVQASAIYAGVLPISAAASFTMPAMPRPRSVSDPLAAATFSRALKGVGSAAVGVHVLVGGVDEVSSAIEVSMEDAPRLIAIAAPPPADAERRHRCIKTRRPTDGSLYRSEFEKGKQCLEVAVGGPLIVNDVEPSSIARQPNGPHHDSN